jgi:hypothetical protein
MKYASLTPPQSLVRVNVRAMRSRMACALVISALTFVGACKPKTTVEAAAPVQSVAEQPQAAPQPVVAAPVIQREQSAAAAPQNQAQPADEAAAGGAVSIAGGWVNAGGACDSGASVQFNPDGTYMSEGENGTWALNGKTLTVTTTLTADAEAVSTQGPDESQGDTGDKAVLTLLSVTDHSARVILSNGSNASWTRCTG